MTRLLIVRHGQTEWNRVERFRGHIDLELNETGVRQAEAAAARLTEWPVAAVYSSPLKRAWRTAEAIAAPLNLEVRPLEGIVDMHFGKWEGLSLAEAHQQYPDLYALWETEPHRVQMPGGEGLPQVQARAMAAVKSLIDRHPADAIALVTHRVVCKLLVLGLLGLDASHFWQIEQNTTGINFFDVRDGLPTAVIINDTCHLRGL
ncbi:MAG: histidine phosphatase family protein [Chloroflexi bacterium]|nr:histidine phosphatase family protein [Chloroflexota bacterium]